MLFFGVIDLVGGDMRVKNTVAGCFWYVRFFYLVLLLLQCGKQLARCVVGTTCPVGLIVLESKVVFNNFIKV